jgi:uncharacterized protein (DUF1800 family)
MMGMTNQQKNLHLLWRAGFGPAAEELRQLETASTSGYLAALTKASERNPVYLNVASDVWKGLSMGVGEAGQLQRSEMNADQKKQLQERSREDLKSLNLAWLDTMVNSDQQLREKMSLFWHGHFASRNLNIFFQQQLLDIIRREALGNFGDLLREVSKSGAMINFLNNNQNRKDHPNENFAREVMELFTLGRGHYSEQDVKEAARAFTGWGASMQGEFVFRPFIHDNGTKTFLGKTGNFSGDEVLDILLEQHQTAEFITRKIYRFFVNDREDPEKISWLAGRFYQSNYHIGRLMQDIFTSEWFYLPANMGCRIKSPVELIVGIRRMLPMEIQNPESQLLLQRLLGQILFYPPNVAGWPGGKSWIDSSTLMMRLRIPQLVSAGDSIQLKPKDDDDQQMGMGDRPEKFRMNVKGNKGMGQQILARIDWETFQHQLDSTPREKLLDAINSWLLPPGPPISPASLQPYLDSSSRESYIRSAAIHLMSSPEYQFC